MRISLVGGMDRQSRHYRQEAESRGIDLRIFNTSEANLSAKIRHSDAVVIFTGKVSHQARREVMKVVASHDIPVFMSHNCGVCALKDCLNCVREGHRPVPTGRE